MTNVFIVSEQDDTGGVGAAIVRAFERYGGPGWNVTAMRGSNNYIDYPQIETWEPDRFRELYEKADLIHGMERLRNVQQAIGHPVDRPAVIHHHGTEFRQNPDLAMHAMSMRWTQLASTIDLCRIHPAVEWLPNPVPMDWFEMFRSQYAPVRDRPFLVGHMPTQRHIKGTDVFLSAFSELPEYVQPLIVEYQPWATSLVAKAKCHAYFDQLAFGFGLSALEAWSMGLPVMSGVHDPSLLEFMKTSWGELPFIHVRSREDLVREISQLAADPDYADNWAIRGGVFVRQHHEESVVVEQLKRIWTDTIARG